MGRLTNGLKAFWQLGWKQSLLYAVYQIMLKSGLLRVLTPVGSGQQSIDLGIWEVSPGPLQTMEFQIDKAQLLRILGQNKAKLIGEAEEILGGKVRLFGGPPQPLDFTTTKPLRHWTAYTAAWVDGQDIKFKWEPGRFGWATVLARAYFITEDERYAEAFWETTEEFLTANPPNLGPHWSSAQEVALRLISLAFSYSLFAASPQTTEAREGLLADAIAAHAARIPPTLIYARAQNNNHLLTEAVGLYTAAALLLDHPENNRWRDLGRKWLNHALQNQITPSGEYVQHSANYHRLMLQAAMWARLAAEVQGEALPERTQERLAAGTQWLLGLLDEDSGSVPNLGPNDGAYILPLTTYPFEDYRPVLQAAGLAFLGEKPFSQNEWDEMALWLVPDSGKGIEKLTPDIHRINGENSWAVLRAAHFDDRPGHADQLHLDLWWRGLNLARDAGTFLYNAPPPWQNTLSGTDVHNTLTINAQDQMTRAGRFLWLDWAQGEVLEAGPNRLTAQHNGYRALGLTHQRTVELRTPDTWVITDSIVPRSTISNRQFTVHLHWLLPDWPWQLDETTLRVRSPHGWVTVAVKSDVDLSPSLGRAGELLAGEGTVEPTRGWYSPTYGVNEPSLSFAIATQAKTPIHLTTTWDFPE